MVLNSKFKIPNSTLIGVDSRDPQNTRIFLFNGKKWSVKELVLNQNTADSQLLAALETSLLSSFPRRRESIRHIKMVVIIGYGARFSSLRLGVIMANALSLAKDIPLYGTTLPADEFDAIKIQSAILKALKSKPKAHKPLYATAPNITIRAS